MAFAPSKLTDAEVIRMWQRKDARDAARKRDDQDDDFDPTTLFDEPTTDAKGK